MTIEAAHQFIVAVNENAVLAEKLSTASSSEVLTLASSHGYEMTMEEFRQTLRSTAAQRERAQGEELSDDQLEEVEGGVVLLIAVTTASVAWAAWEVYKMGDRREWW